MTSHTPTERPGHSDAPQGAERAHTLVILAVDRPGSLDRVVGVLRRRRAVVQTLVIGPSNQQEIVRVTAVVKDSEVAVDHLIEQLRKVVDVQHVDNLTEQQAVLRELALIKVNSTPEGFNDIIEIGHFFGAHTVDVAVDTVTLEVVGSEEKIEKLINMLQEYDIREVARSGRVVMRRDVTDSEVTSNKEKE